MHVSTCFDITIYNLYHKTRMKLRTLILIACGSLSMMLTSCLKSEGADREADILEFTIENDPNLLTTIIPNDKKEISLIMSTVEGYREATIVPNIVVSKGATVEPASGTPVKLNNYQHYFTVTAQDGGQNTYLVRVEPLDQLNQDFEQWDSADWGDRGSYFIPSNPMWVNANEGVKMVWKKERGEYPTSRSEDVREGAEGKYSAKLSTLKGSENSLNDLMDLPVLSGNMYRGTFNALLALNDPLKTTKFGQPYPEFLGNPLRLKAWYKYTRGTDGFTTWKYVNGKKKVEVVQDIDDMPDIYAVLYKVPKGNEGINTFLTALDVKTSDKIVAMAQLDDVVSKEVLDSQMGEWNLLEMPFKYRETIDHSKYNYKLAIVLASSRDGANYKGAIGSVLLVDDIEVETEEKELN